MSAEKKPEGNTALGRGCLAVILLAIIGLAVSCFGGSDEPVEPRSEAVAPTSTAAPSTPPPPVSTPSPLLTTTAGPAPRAAPTTTSPAGTPRPQPNPNPQPNPQPDPDPQPAPSRTRAPEPTPDESDDVHYANCDAVRAAGAAPIRRGEPGYRPGLDRDGDGQGCGAD